MFRFDSFKKHNTAENNNEPPTFLQRIASADSILGVSKQRSSSNLSSTSFSIPMPTNSWGMLALTKLQDEQDGELDDIVDLLLTRDKVNTKTKRSKKYIYTNTRKKTPKIRRFYYYLYLHLLIPLLLLTANLLWITLLFIKINKGTQTKLYHLAVYAAYSKSKELFCCCCC